LYPPLHHFSPQELHHKQGGTEAKFLDVTGKKVLSTNGFYSHPPSKSDMKLVCNVNSVYVNLKSENYQDYAQKPQRNCTFMKSASVQEGGGCNQCCETEKGRE
jgi:hypothetical protein